MPWTQRAFVLNILHPTSQIMVGVFDHNRTSNLFFEPVHDTVGRVLINVSNCRPGTVYTMKYNLHDIKKRERRVRGSITLRIRVEWKSERLTLMAATSTVNQHYVSVAKKQFFRTTYYTLSNEVSSGIFIKTLLQMLLACFNSRFLGATYSNNIPTS